MPDRISIFADRPVTISISLAMTLTSLAAFRNRDLYHKWILHPHSIFKRKEIFRLLTSGFVHNDLVHLLINCVMVFFICGELEHFLRARSGSGSLLFLTLYAVSHFTGALTVTWKNRRNFDYSSAGASGSILGCMMSFMILAPKFTAFYLPVLDGVENQYAALILIVGLIVYRWRSGNELMDNELHFYSALGGIAATFVLFPHLL
jgi:membrane associated rhomboid family serine protease